MNGITTEYVDLSNSHKNNDEELIMQVYREFGFGWSFARSLKYPGMFDPRPTHCPEAIDAFLWGGLSTAVTEAFVPFARKRSQLSLAATILTCVFVIGPLIGRALPPFQWQFPVAEDGTTTTYIYYIIYSILVFVLSQVLLSRLVVPLMKSAANDKCFWCHQTETQDHLFQCPHQSTWQDEFLERLAAHLADTDTDPTVKEEVLECVESWLHQSSFPSRCDQRRIGTHLLIRGYVANEWTQLQDQYCKDATDASKQSATGEAWTRKLILYLWDEAFQLWDKRNKEIFESDDSSTRIFDLKQQATEIYALEDKVLARDRYNFDTPLTDRINHSTPYQLHNFVHIQGPIIRQSVKEAEKLAAANTHALPELFTLR
jgi:hypothetical protein